MVKIATFLLAASLLGAQGCVALPAAPPSAPTEVARTATPAPAPPPVLEATTAPTPTATPPSPRPWLETAALLVAPGEPEPQRAGRLYALVGEGPGPLWAFPSEDVRLMISDDDAATWVPFPGGLPVTAACMVNVNLDYAAPDAGAPGTGASGTLFASTCQGLYAWDAAAGAWTQISDRLTDAVAVAYGLPDQVWATAHGDGVIRSADGGRTWQDASAGLITFGGMANLALDPRDNNTLYGIIQPQYAGSYLRRGAADGQWETMPTPLENAAIQTGMALDGAAAGGGTGALYVTTQVAPVGLWRSPNPDAADVNQVEWELVHDFGAAVQVSLLACGWSSSPDGPALYANIWPLTPVDDISASVGPPVLHRSRDGGQTWEPLATP